MIFGNPAKSALVKYSVLLLIKDIGLDDSWAQIGTILIMLNTQELKIGKRNFFLGKKWDLFFQQNFFTMGLIVNVL